jgi:integrase
MNSLIIPFFGHTPLDRLDTQLVEQYKSRKISEGLTNKTVNNHLTVLSSCLRTAQDWLDITRIPKMIRLKTAPPKVDFLSQEECDLLLSHSSGFFHDIILMALKTGLRRGELIALSWSDINWSNQTLTVRHSWCEASRSVGTTKRIEFIAFGQFSEIVFVKVFAASKFG